MTTKLVELKQELNTALLKVIEKDGVIGRLSKQLQSECRTLALSSPFLRTRHNLSLCLSLRDSNRAGAIADDPGAGCGCPDQARDAQCESEAAHQKTIKDLAKLGRAISTVVATLGVSLRPVTPDTLVGGVGRLQGAVRELELVTT
jgi:hypothetical protein